MTKIILLLLLSSTILANLTTESDDYEEYKAWKAKHGKDFEASEDRYRMYLFKKTQATIKAHNQNPENTYKKGQNKFSAYTQEELTLKYLGAKAPKGKVSVSHSSTHKTVSQPVVGSGQKNWVADLNASRVRNQGQCGACWAFSGVGAIEFSYLINGTDVDLSEQHLVDCAYPYNGCWGGWMDVPMQFALEVGLTTEADYPYNQAYGTCQNVSEAYKISKASGVYSQPGDCSALEDSLLNVGPSAVGVFVDVSDWFDYQSGTYSCSSSVTIDTIINHAVMAVGVDATTILIQNSWGTGWGEAGLMRISKTANCNVCKHEFYLPEL